VIRLAQDVDLTAFSAEPFLNFPAVVQDSNGLLGRAGRVLGIVIVPPLPTLSGVSLWFGAATLDPVASVLTEVSNNVQIVFQERGLGHRVIQMRSRPLQTWCVRARRRWDVFVG